MRYEDLLIDAYTSTGIGDKLQILLACLCALGVLIWFILAIVGSVRADNGRDL